MTNPRKIIADVAREFLGLREATPNRGPHFEEFWAATTIADGADQRLPWCSAFASFCVHEADLRSPEINLRKPPRFPAVSQWLPWANDPANGCQVFTSQRVAGGLVPMAGDIVVFLPKLSHVGIVAADYLGGSGLVQTIEGNTNAAGGREGDGVFEKQRALSFCGSFIRIPAVALPA